MNNTQLFTDLIASTQIITESAPISSSGHVALVSSFLGVSVPEWYLDTTHIITLTLIASLFYASWWFIVRRAALSLVRRNWQKVTYRRFWHILSRYVLAVLVIDCLSASLYLGIKAFVPAEEPYFLAFGFGVSALALMSTRFSKSANGQLNALSILVLGTAQGLAALPSLSRMALTYAAAEWLGFKGKRALELSFAIQIPLIVGALARAGLKSDTYFYALWPNGSYESLMIYLSASALSFFLLYAVKKMAERRIMWWWGFYLVIPASLALIMK